MKQYTGLTTEEARRLLQEGRGNAQPSAAQRTVRDIFISNIVTFFNLLNLLLVFLVFSVGSYKNALFFLVVIFNTSIGILQELRTRRALNKLRIMSISHCAVLRDGKKQRLPVDQLVPGDVLILEAGDQIPADCRVLSGWAEADESLLTGESHGVVRQTGDEIMSGSFLTSGSLTCLVERTGADSYSYRLTTEAKSFRKAPSLLRRNMNRIVGAIGVILVPVGLLLFCKEYFIGRASLHDGVVHTAAAMVGMIPEGLVLLTSVSLMLGVLKLSKRRVLVQQLYCIETLAQADVLCLDKTGTITEGVMRVQETRCCQNGQIERCLSRLTGALHGDGNATMRAIRSAFPPEKGEALRTIPFSSQNKYSGAVFADGTILMGAADFLFPDRPDCREFREECRAQALLGYRVVAVAQSRHPAPPQGLPAGLVPVGFVLLSDSIREQAPETLEYFRRQDVTLKILSGDDPATVSRIAEKAGFSDVRPVDASTLQTPEALEEAVGKYNVFGRVSPEQKKAMVLALKKAGHTVAMTGDGVNDVPALKQADCSVAMASGSDAAKRCANLVLLDSDFTALPSVVSEGRRVINNIRMASSMFLIKTIFSLLLSLCSLLLGDGYPFEPIQMTLIGTFSTGIPTLLLQLEPNYERVGRDILLRSIRSALPAALTITLCVLAAVTVNETIGMGEDVLAGVCTLITGIAYTSALYRVYRPLTPMRCAVIITCQVLLVLCLLLGHRVLNLVRPGITGIVSALVLTAVTFPLAWALDKLPYRFLNRIFSDESRFMKKGVRRT